MRDHDDAIVVGAGPGGTAWAGGQCHESGSWD